MGGSKAKTGNTFANMNKADFGGIVLIAPETSTLKLFHEKVEATFEAILNRTVESQYLTQLRDWLLPMLMNGQVTVA